MQALSRIFRMINSLPELPKTLDAEALALHNYRCAPTALNIFAEVPNLHGLQVLDLGCGLGGKTLYYAKQGARLVVGVDISRTRAHVAQTLTDKYAPSGAVHIIVSDAADLPFQADTFDGIISIDAWEHLYDTTAALSQCKRAVRPGGTIWISAMPYLSPWGAHAWNWLPMPWLQVVLPARAVFKLIAWIEVWRRINRRLPLAVRLDWSQPDDPAHARGLTLRAVEHDLAISGLTTIQFAVVPVGARYKGVIRRLSYLLIRLPFLRELLAGMIVLILRKAPLS
jgi:SAM-dependent methyltransferase